MLYFCNIKLVSLQRQFSIAQLHTMKKSYMYVNRNLVWWHVVIHDSPNVSVAHGHLIIHSCCRCHHATVQGPSGWDNKHVFKHVFKKIKLLFYNDSKLPSLSSYFGCAQRYSVHCGTSGCAVLCLSIVYDALFLCLCLFVSLVMKVGGGGGRGVRNWYTASGDAVLFVSVWSLNFFSCVPFYSTTNYVTRL